MMVQAPKELVLDLKTTKTSQAVEITKLKEKVKKLERRNKSRTSGIKRLRKVGRSAQVVSSEDEGLGAQEDASKLGRKITDLDANVEEVKVEKVVSTAKVTTVKEEKLAKQREEDSNIIEWDNVQAMIDADYELVVRLQAQEQEELTIEEKSKLFVKDKRKKHFARLKSYKQRRKPPTKAQRRNQMCTYLKNMVGFTHSQLKNNSFNEVQKDFDKTMGWIDSFISMDSEVVKGEQEKAKKQKIDDDEAEMKKYMEVVPDDEVAIDAITLATKPPVIVD
ncbi:hypothetical protein Tco_1206742 [Tanacetum coccineum]